MDRIEALEGALLDRDKIIKLQLEDKDRLADQIMLLKAVVMSESEKDSLLSKDHYRDRVKELKAKLADVSSWGYNRLTGKGCEHPNFCGCGECESCRFDCELDDRHAELKAILDPQENES